VFDNPNTRRLDMSDPTHPGMVLWRLRNTETGEEAEYEACDLQCAQLLAAEDHGGEPEDWSWRE
jgi:hypothetical protein